ncbi:hypothetical protein [Vagococcus sp. WN89Y]|uniref:hypothetical protein n=1 Tax=Vagococcus sp. WN89Y TaxID=3457258 RepID=UPI003FCCC7DB
MPAITNTATGSGTFSDHSSSENNQPHSSFTRNLLSSTASATDLTHHSSDESQCNNETTMLQIENNGDPPENVTSRLLSLEEYEQFELHKKRHCLPSCQFSLWIASIALMTTVGAFVWNRFNASSNNPPAVDNPPSPENKDVMPNHYFPETPQHPVLAPLIFQGVTLHNSKARAHNPPCYLLESGVKTNIEIPCHKGKQGLGKKRWSDIETLPVCIKRKVVKRCRRKHVRSGQNLEKLVISRKGKRCVCAPQTRNEEITTAREPDRTQTFFPLKRGNEFRYVDERIDSVRIKTNTSLTATIPDEVAIKKMFDQTCADERDNLSGAQIYRQFGQTLSNPISQAYKEGRIAYEYVIKETGCPSPESLEAVMNITAAVDYAVSSVVSLLPGTKLLTVAQNIIAPILELIADDLEGKQLDISKLINVDQQIMFMMRPAIPTMNRNEQAALYGKLAKGVDIPKAETKILTNRYNFHENQVVVNVEGKEYLLHKGIDNRPFVERNRFINFNHLNKRWDFVRSTEDDTFSKVNLQNRDYYGVSLEQLPDNARIDFNEYDFVTIRAADKEDMKGVFLGGKLIPADWDYVGNQFVAYTHDGNYLEQRVIIFGNYGWVFEKPSVQIDKNLQIYLDSYETGIDYYPENHISVINDENGLCRSQQESNFIKKDYKYYEVRKSGGEIDTWVLANNPYVQIKRENGIFKLKYADDMLFGLQSERIPGALNEKNVFYLETAALDYLQDHAVMTQAAPVREIRPGLYLDSANKPLFIINNKKFAVTKYTDRYVYLQREQDGRKGDILLWADRDSWIRVRDDERLASEFQDVSTCRIARSPVRTKECLPVVIETDLHVRLQKYIDSKTTSNHYPVPGSLRQLKTYDTPAIFQDINTGKNYFLYAGNYFDAKLIDTLDVNNPTGSPIIKVTGRGSFFNREKFIADIILEHKEERVEIKEVDTFVAEKLNVNKDIASFYNKNRRYRYQPSIPAVEDLANEVEASGGTFVTTQPQESIGVKRTQVASAHYSRVKEALFPARIIKSLEHEIDFKKLDAQADPLDTRMKLSQQYIKQKLQYLKEKIIPAVQTSLNYDEYSWADTGMYLSLLLDSGDVRFLTDAGEAWRQALERLERTIDSQEIYLVRAVNNYAKAARNLDANPYQSSQERYAGKVLIMPDKEDNRLFINIDKLGLSENMQQTTDHDLIGLMMEEIFSSSKLKNDYYNTARANGIYPSAHDMAQEMIEKIELQNLTSAQMSSLKEISRAYLEKIPAYRPHIEGLLTPPKLAYLARNDRGYLAHLLLHSSSCLTAMTEDIYSQLAQAQFDSEKNDPWVTNYISKRELNTVRKEVAMSTGGLEIDKLSAFNTDDVDLGFIIGKQAIYYTEPGIDLLYRLGDNYYPVEFVGKSNRIVFLGSRDKPRHVYYYNPLDGELIPLQKASSYNNQLSYNRQLDLYQSFSGDTGETSVLKYDTKTERLVATEAKKITPLVNNVIKVECQNFDLFYPENAGNEIFLAAHGSQQINLKDTRVPENAKIFFYTKRWHSLNGHMDDLMELVKGKISSVESRDSWDKLETYDITLDQDSQINYSCLAQESHKSLIRVKPGAQISSKDLIEAVSTLFSDKKIDIHLYICRSI